MEPGSATVQKAVVPLFFVALAGSRRRSVELFLFLRKVLLAATYRIQRACPVWPPPPDVLLHQGSAIAVVAALLLALSGLCRSGSGEEDEDGRAWVAQAREQRRVVLQDLLRSLPLERLCSATPGLCELLKLELADATADERSESAYHQEYGVTAESISEAAEKLAKADRTDPTVWEGYAVAAALTAGELMCAVRNLDASTSPAAAGDSDVDLNSKIQDNGAELDALRMRVTTAEELAAQIEQQCPTVRLARRVTALYARPLRAARDAVRTRRALQWRCAAQLLWRFRGTLPFIALSSALSMVLGTFSAMQLHYQAAVINLAKDAVTVAASAANGSTVARFPSGSAGKNVGVGQTIGAMVVSEVISQLAQFARARLASRGKMRVVRELKASLFQALLRQDLAYLEQSDLWQLRSLIGSCGSTIGQVVDFPQVLLESAFRLLSAAVALWRKSSRLAAFLAVVLPARLFLGQLITAMEDRIEQRTSLPDFRGQINACWAGLVRPKTLRTMRAFAREPLEASTFARFLSTHDRLQEHGQLIYRLFQPLSTLLEHGTEIGALWYGGRLALRGEVEFGDLASFMLVAQGAFDGARYVRAAGATVSSQALGPMAQMAALLARRPRIGLDYPPLSSMPDACGMQWNIRFENVSFAYPQRPGAWALRNLSFKAQAGEFLGMVGTTGAGKSTIFALLLRMYEPVEGRILLNGCDLRDYNPLWLRRHIGFVSQDLDLCERSVRENLVYGCMFPGPSDEEARKALRVAQCEDVFFDVRAFPNFWHTDVGEGGSNLSGGERQRLGIARAILKRPQLLLLDEATSALDELSQARLQDALEEFRKERGLTIICVAHRLSNLTKADRLVVLQHGCAVEQGTPIELLAAPGGVFAEYARTHAESVPTAGTTTYDTPAAE